MKKHFWNFLHSSSGSGPVPDIRVHVFLANLVTESELVNSSISTSDILSDVSNTKYARVGISESSLPTTYLKTDVTEIYTDNIGKFDFWVSDIGEDGSYLNNGGYVQSQKFTIAFVKRDYETLVIENVDIFPNGYSVNEEDTNDIKNKLVNNNIIYNLTNHLSASYDVGPHNIEQFDETAQNTDIDWELNNKLINNKYLVNLKLDVVNLISEVNTLSGYISSLEGGEISIESTVDDLVTLTNSLDSDLTNLTSLVESLSGDVETNANNILNNYNSILNNASNISTNASNISDNNSDITTNANRILINTNNILTNTNNILTNTKNILRNTINIESLSGDVETNTINIESLSGDKESINFISNLNTIIFNGLTTIDYVRQDVNEFDTLYYNQSLSGYSKSLSDGWDKMPVEVMALETKLENELCKVLHYGTVRNDGWNWNIGSNKILYTSDTISGGMTQTDAPSASGTLKQSIGIVKTPKEIKFNPTTNIIEN